MRMSLGGVRDEAEIRGHRRTYIGALPGRLVRALRDAGAMNPVIMLDEVDKLGADWRGDPSAALLEVLDPAQNHAFQDHYLDVELDFHTSSLLRLPTLWKRSHGPLLDRMEVIRFNGYTTDEKVAIARDYSGRASRAERLRKEEVDVDDAVLRTIVTITPARRECASSSASLARCCARPRRRSRQATGRRRSSIDVTPSVKAWAGRRSFRRPRRAPPFRAWPPAWP